MRNKPKEPIQKPKSAPFFLPTLEGLDPDFDMESTSKENSKNETQRLLKNVVSISSFARKLLDCYETKDYSPAIERLMHMNPNEIDFEIRSLDVQVVAEEDMEETDEYHLLHCFLEAIKSSLGTRMNYELIQSYLAVFLKVHSNTILNNPILSKACRELGNLNEPFVNLQDMFDESVFIINFIRGAV